MKNDLNGIWWLVSEFQTLISGLLAIAAAIITSYVIYRSARLPVEQQERQVSMNDRRRLSYVSMALGRDLFTLAARARQVEGTIKVVIAAQTEVTDATREKVYLKFPALAEEWESMSLMPEQTFMNLSRLMRQVDDHNFDMARAGGSFGADNFREHILARIQQIQMSAKAVGKQVDMLRAKDRKDVPAQKPNP